MTVLNLSRKTTPDAGSGDTTALASARRTIEVERAGLDALDAALGNGLGAPFAAAVALIRAAGGDAGETASGRAVAGRVIVSGMGKSGHVGRKIAATFASTGTPAFFVHPAEASHGDLGMIAPNDVVLALSWSGETAELKSIVEYARRFDIPLIAITAMPESSLAREATVVLTLPQAAEACPHGLAPTTSALMQLALGDALAIALLESRGFTPEKFRVFHPGGRLGASLHLVRDIMHRGAEMPLVALGTTMAEAVSVMTEKRFGCVGILDASGRLAGIVTDGDLRRHLGPDLLTAPVEAVMTRNPKTIEPDMLVGAALDLLNQAKIMTLFILEDGRPLGIVHMHDFLKLGAA